MSDDAAHAALCASLLYQAAAAKYRSRSLILSKLFSPRDQTASPNVIANILARVRRSQSISAPLRTARLQIVLNPKFTELMQEHCHRMQAAL